MIIAVTTAPSSFSASAAFYRFMDRCLQLLAQQHPEWRFVIISDRKDIFTTREQVRIVASSPKGRSPLAIKYWYDYQLPHIVKKQQADAWLALDGYCSLRSRVPQLLLVTRTGFLHPGDTDPKKQSALYRKRMAAALQKVQQVLTLSEFSKTQLSEKYNCPQEKITVCYPGPAPAFQPVDWEEREKIKEKYAEGKEYFLFSGTIEPGANLHHILKAFSLFKKRQKSGMQLLIAGAVKEGYTRFTDDLASYKYRNEVKLVGLLPAEEIARLTAGAYALLLPVDRRDYAWPPLEAMHCDVPVLAGKDSVFPELCGDAATYADAADFNDIAQHMMLLFKDETERDRLIRAGREQVKPYTDSKAASILGRLILAAGNG